LIRNIIGRVQSLQATIMNFADWTLDYYYVWTIPPVMLSLAHLWPLQTCAIQMFLASSFLYFKNKNYF